MGCYCIANLKNFKKLVAVGYDKILRNIQAESRKLFSKGVECKTFLPRKVIMHTKGSCICAHEVGPMGKTSMKSLLKFKIPTYAALHERQDK